MTQAIEREPVAVARQGHAYDHFGTRVLALSSGPRPSIRAIEGLWLGPLREADAADLVALPMAYFHGQVPR